MEPNFCIWVSLSGVVDVWGLRPPKGIPSEYTLSIGAIGLQDIGNSATVFALALTGESASQTFTDFYRGRGDPLY